MPIRGSFTLLRAKGVPIRVHWTLLLILPYIAVIFSRDFAAVAGAAGVSADRIELSPLFWGAVLAVALFASVAVHELAHSFVALRSGGHVREITLMLLGGVSQIERMPGGGRREVLMAAAGPATSLGLGALLFAARALLPQGAMDLRLGVFYLAQVNVALGLFNLLPAFPMDGGRVLRGLLAARVGPLRATRAAARVGKILAVCMALLGLWGGNFLLVLVAFFVYSGAGQEVHAEETRGALAGLRVADVMRTRPPAVALDMPLAGLPALMRAAGRMELVVVDNAAHPIGLVRASDLLELSAAERERAVVGDLGDRVSRGAMQVSQEESAASALDRAEQSGAEYILAVDAESKAGPVLVGLLERREIEKTVLLRSLEGARRTRATYHVRAP